jgi:hypothetical protein
LYLISVDERQRTFALNSMVELRSRAPPHRPTAHRLPIRDARYCDQSGLQAASEHGLDNADERCATPREHARADAYEEFFPADEGGEGDRNSEGGASVFRAQNFPENCQAIEHSHVRCVIERSTTA